MCDEYGFELGRAVLPGTDHTVCHDACGSELFDLTREASLRHELQPRHIFTTLIPVALLMAPGRPPSIVPDASIDVALPRVETSRGQRRGHALALRRLLFDVKTIHGGTAHYYTAHAAEERAGAVRHRERQVAQDYLSHARQLDREHHGAAGTAAGPPGPIEQRLMSFTTPRGLVFGQYGEASADVHDLIRIAADAIAEKQWRLAGARTKSEMRGFLISRSRRRVGLRAVQAMARHRLARVPYVGVPYVALADRAQRRAGAFAAHDAPDPTHADFFQFQQGHVQRD